jgi:hypothetical protein
VKFCKETVIPIMLGLLMAYTYLHGKVPLT